MAFCEDLFETCLNLDAGTEMGSANKHLQTALKDCGSRNHETHLQRLISNKTSVCHMAVPHCIGWSSEHSHNKSVPPNLKLFIDQSCVDLSQMLGSRNLCAAFHVSIQHRVKAQWHAMLAGRKRSGVHTAASLLKPAQALHTACHLLAVYRTFASPTPVTGIAGSLSNNDRNGNPSAIRSSREGLYHLLLYQYQSIVVHGQGCPALHLHDRAGPYGSSWKGIASTFDTEN